MGNEVIVGTLIGAGIAVGAGLLVHAIGDRDRQGSATNTVVAANPPELCLSVNSKQDQPIIVKVGATLDADGNTTGVLRFPQHNCAGKTGTVLTWVADTLVKSMTVRFIADPTVKCTLAKDGLNPDMGHESTMEADPLNGTLKPLSITLNRPVVTDTNFGYCLTVNDFLDPNPAIIVKE